jgi:hypothetical protein
MYLKQDQLPGLLLFLTAVVQAQHGLVHDPGQVEDRLYFFRSRHPLILVLERYGNLGFEKFTPPVLLFHYPLIISKAVSEVK